MRANVRGPRSVQMQNEFVKSLAGEGCEVVDRTGVNDELS